MYRTHDHKSMKPYIDIVDEIKASEKEYKAYADSTGLIRSAHFRGNGTIRITDDQRMITLEDARIQKDIKWKLLRKE